MGRKDFCREAVHPMYCIIMCYNCGRLLLATKDQKSRRCPHCEARINTERARFIASAATAREASELIRKLKEGKAPPHLLGDR